ncbi:MAG: RloB family protein [Chloroflexota bacterium]|nr:RloB family protein [Chloroflexota bacterium]
MARRRRSRIRPHQRPTESRPRILILCEGQKTEHVYFAALKVEMRLSSVRVWRPSKVRGPRGLTRAADDARLNDPGLDEIWCVLDQDGREEEVRQFAAWHDRTSRRRGGPRIEAVISDPCFEYWLLLHFEYTTRPFDKVGGCEQSTRMLRRHVNDYRKGDRRFFESLRGLRDTAIENAERAARAGPSPGTDIGRLIQRLRELV